MRTFFLKQWKNFDLCCCWLNRWNWKVSDKWDRCWSKGKPLSQTLKPMSSCRKNHSIYHWQCHAQKRLHVIGKIKVTLPTLLTFLRCTHTTLNVISNQSNGFFFVFWLFLGWDYQCGSFTVALNWVKMIIILCERKSELKIAQNMTSVFFFG